MKQVIELLGKTVKFVHTENGHFFEEQGKENPHFSAYFQAFFNLLFRHGICGNEFAFSPVLLRGTQKKPFPTVGMWVKVCILKNQWLTIQ